MNKNDLIYKRTARRIIESPRSREQMLSVLDNTPPIVPETEEEAYERGYTAGQMAQCKTGKWIDNHTTCSECGWQMIDDVTESPNIVGFNFCPNCGADMRGEQE